MTELICAPFSEQQRARLQMWQVAARWHPFTCPNDGRSLVPLDRWVCSACDYEQSWAHAFMVEEDVHGRVPDVRDLRDLREGELHVEAGCACAAAGDDSPGVAAEEPVGEPVADVPGV